MICHRAAVSVLSALLLLAACASSPPTRFYTLSDTSPATPAPPGVGLITLDRVTIPGEIDRPELVRRTGSNRVTLSDEDRWAAPLDEIIRRVLTDDIARRVPSPVAGQQYGVSLDVHEFYGDAACNVTLRAVWTPRRTAATSAAPAPPVNEEIRTPSSGACPATLPQTMSLALGELSDRIVATVARLPQEASKD